MLAARLTAYIMIELKGEECYKVRQIYLLGFYLRQIGRFRSSLQMRQFTQADLSSIIDLWESIRKLLVDVFYLWFHSCLG